jgi:hypothetical protein
MRGVKVYHMDNQARAAILEAQVKAALAGHGGSPVVAHLCYYYSYG